MRTKPPAADQDELQRSLASLCAAPTRAEQDPGFAEPGARAEVLGNHLSDGVTHPDVLAKIEGWRSPEKPAEQKLAELDALIKRAGLSTTCRLQEVWADPDWGASELGP
jgi:hypothetical protein